MKNRIVPQSSLVSRRSIKILMPLVCCLCVMVGVWTATRVVRSAARMALQESSFSVRVIAFSPNGQRLAAGLDDGTIRIWDAAKEDSLTTLRGHGGAVAKIVFSPDGKLLVSSDNYDYALKIWDVAAGKELKSIALNDSSKTMVISPDGHAAAFSADASLLVFADQGKIFVLKVGGFETLQAINSGMVNNLAFSHDGKSLVSYHYSEGLKVWSVSNGKLLRQFKPGTGEACLTSDGQQLIGSKDSRIRVFDAQTGAEASVFSGFVSTNTLTLSPDGQFLANTYYDDPVELWHVASGQKVQTIPQGKNQGLRSLAFTPDSKILAGAITDKATIKLWSVETGKERATLTILDEQKWIVTTPDGRFNASAGALETLRAENRNAALAVVRENAKRPQQALLAELFGVPTNAQTATAQTAKAQNENSQTSQSSEGRAVRATPANLPDSSAVINQARASNAADGKEQPEVTISLATAGFRLPSFHPTERLLASVSGDAVQIWDLRTGIELRSLTGHKGDVNAALFSPDGSMIVSSGRDRTIRFWSLATGALLRQFTAGPIGGLAYSHDGRRLASLPDFLSATDESDFQIKIWDAQAGTLLHSLQVSPKVAGIAFSPDDKLILSGDDTSLKLFDVETGAVVRAVKAHDKSVTALAFSPDGKTFASGSEDRTIKLWDASDGHLLRALTGHEEKITYLAFSPDGQRLASASGGDDLLTFNDNIKLWTVATGKEISTLEASGDPVFSPDGKTLAVSGEQITLFDFASGVKLRTLRGHAEAFRDISFTPDGQTLMTGGIKTTRLINLQTGTRFGALASSGYSDPASEATFSPDGRLAAMNVNDERVELLDVAFGRTLRAFQIGEVSICFSSDSRLIAIHDGSTIKIWETATGRERASLTAGELLSTMRFSPRGNFLLTDFYPKGTQTSQLKIFDLRSNKLLHTLSLGPLSVNGLAFSPDDKSFAFDDRNGIHLFDIEDGKQRQLIKAETGLVLAMKFSPDSRLLATAGALLKIFDAQTGTEVRTLVGHTGFVTSVVFDARGETLASGGDDKTIRLWTVATGAALRVLEGHTGAIKGLAFSPDGARFASNGADARTKLWDVASGKEIVSFISMDTDEMLAMTPDNFFQASRGALRDIAFRFGARTFPFEQFDLKYNRPDIVLARLGSANQSLIEAYRRAYQKRLRHLNFTEEMLGNSFQLPEVKITTSLPVTTRSDTLQFNVRATDEKFTLDRLNVYVNNVPVNGANGIDLKAAKAHTAEQSISLQLARGRNRIEVSALNEKGAESLRETVEVNCDAPAVKPDLYVVAIGVSTYADASYNLTYAAKDASDLAAMWERNEGNRFAHVYVRRILDKEATRENITAAKEFLMKSKVDDEVVLSVAGHGLLDEQLDYYFGTTDIDFNHPAERGLTYDALESLLDGIPARRKLFLMDTCHAGEVDKEDVKIVNAAATTNTSEGVVTRRAFPRGVKVKKIGLDNSYELLQALFADLRRGSGALVISAASGAEYALESDEWHNGVFTYTILNGIKTGQADGNRDGGISVAELRGYVASEVSKLTEGQQTPVARRGNFEFDFDLTRKGGLLRTLTHAFPVNAIAWSPDGSKLASTSMDQSLRLWNASSGEQLRLVNINWPGLPAVAWTPDGKLVACAISGEGGSVVELRNAASGELVRNISVPGYINTAIFNPDGRYLASAGDDKQITLSETATGKNIRTFKGHSKTVIALAWSADGRVLASGSLDHTIKLWNADTGQELRTLAGHAKTLRALAFTPDGKLLASTSEDGTIRLWNTETGALLQNIKVKDAENEFSGCLAISRDGALLLTGHQDGTARLWRIPSGEPLGTIEAHTKWITAIAFSPDGQWFATGGGDNEIKLWRVSDFH